MVMVHDFQCLLIEPSSVVNFAQLYVLEIHVDMVLKKHFMGLFSVELPTIYIVS